MRITLLLLVLFIVGMNNWLTQLRSTDWEESLWVVVYPVNGDNSRVSQQYIGTLSADTFDAIETFLASEAQRYGQAIREPVSIYLAPQVSSHPPMPPAGGGTLSIMLWSLKLRYWAWRNDTFDGPPADVQMFVVYHDPQTHSRVRHSLGLRKGMVGVVNAYAGHNMAQRNNVVIAHEFLHTVGASDKYDVTNNQPDFPDGYAEPDRTPLYPQRKAEIMGGRIPLSEHDAVMPTSVARTSVGNKTAQEINWIN
ncbi:MAG TPA: hypothetical protein ENJ80_01395 [Gammaproteobacteria bacterium]|nr:hypothetical protein [Gammaproteobacteria bacterium]